MGFDQGRSRSFPRCSGGSNKSHTERASQVFTLTETAFHTINQLISLRYLTCQRVQPVNLVILPDAELLGSRFQLPRLQLARHVRKGGVARLRKRLGQGNIAQTEIVVIVHNTATNFHGARARHGGIGRHQSVLHPRRCRHHLERRSGREQTSQRQITFFIGITRLSNGQDLTRRRANNDHHRFGIRTGVHCFLGSVLHLLTQTDLDRLSRSWLLLFQALNDSPVGIHRGHLPPIFPIEFVIHYRRHPAQNVRREVRVGTDQSRFLVKRDSIDPFECINDVVRT